MSQYKTQIPELGSLLFDPKHRTNCKLVTWWVQPLTKFHHLSNSILVILRNGQSGQEGLNDPGKYWEEEEAQVNTLVYLMGDETDNSGQCTPFLGRTYSQ